MNIQEQKKTYKSKNNLTLQYKPDLERTKKYWDAFWSHEMIDRPCTVVWAEKCTNACPPVIIQSISDDFQTTFKEFDKYLDTHAFLGECIPGFRPGFGPDQMAGFLGAPIIRSQDSLNTSWSQKIVDNWKKFLPLKIDEQNECWHRMKEFHIAASEYYAEKCLIYNIDLHSNIDTLEGLRGAEKLLFDIIDTPYLIKQAMADVEKVYKKIYNTFFTLSKGQKIGTGDRCLGLYNKERFNIIAADFISLLSPDLFRSIVLPALEEEALFLDKSCFHLDGPDALVHLNDILAIEKIDVVQWQPGEYNKPAADWPEVIDKIQSAGKAAVLPGSCEQIKAIHGRYKPELVVYNAWAKSETEGNELLDWLQKNT
jgi:hypothetical protein